LHPTRPPIPSQETPPT